MNVPEDLKKQNRWVLWKKEPVKKNGKTVADANGEVKYTKVPYQPNGKKASSTNPKTWASFEAVSAVLDKYSGIGFVLGDGYCGIDIDNVPQLTEDIRAFQEGETNTKVGELLSLNTYVEISPSGNGLHALFIGKLPGKAFKNSEEGIELYDGGRFFTVTGNRVSQSNHLADLTDSIQSFYDKYKKKTHHKASSVPATAGNGLTLEEVIEKAEHSKKGQFFSDLMLGNWQAYYSSQSEADLALCNMLAFWTAKDKPLMDEIFRLSQLMRPKWDEKHGADTYGNITLDNAIANCQKVYKKRERIKQGQDTQNKLVLRETENGVVLKTPYNVRAYMGQISDLTHNIVYNEFTQRIEKLQRMPWGTPSGWWSDEDSKLLAVYLDNLFWFNPSREIIDQAVLSLAKTKLIHPLKDRITSTPWDNVPRAERYFIDTVGCADTTYTREITRVWLTGLIARIYNPGCKFEIVPILTGGQGIGKSTVCARLFPEQFTDKLKTFGEKEDDYRILKSVAVVELGEMKGFSNAKIENVKSFLSAQSDELRMPYGRFFEQSKRHCVFIGTSNSENILKDETGERRFYPLECGINDVGTHPMALPDSYYQQVLAEAKTWYDAKAPLTLSKETLEEAGEIQAKHKAIDLDKDRIQEYLEIYIPEDWYELSSEERQLYYRHYVDLPIELDEFKRNIVNSFTPTDTQLSLTSVNDIAFIVFGDDPIKGRQNQGTKHGKIKLVLDNHKEWERVPKRMKLYKKGNAVWAYKRK